MPAVAELAVAHLTGVRDIKDEIDIAASAVPADVMLFVRDALDRYAPDGHDFDADLLPALDEALPGRARARHRAGFHRRRRRAIRTLASRTTDAAARTT